MTEKAEDVLYNEAFTDGIIGPDVKRAGKVVDGGKIIFETSPGCWGANDYSEHCE